MKTGVLVADVEFPAAALVRALAGRGYNTAAVVTTYTADDFAAARGFLESVCEAVLVCGNVTRFFDDVRAGYDIDETHRVFHLADKLYILCDKYDAAFVDDVAVPALNSKCRTFYTTARFKTFGKTEAELRDCLQEQMKNRNRIAFDFYPARDECEVVVRYSSKTDKDSVADILSTVSEKLRDCVYSFGDADLAETVSDLLRVRGKKLCLAESFTGGRIAATLTAIPGASAFLHEGIVCYAPAAKVERLGVEENIIQTYGAVSIETAYEMAAGLLMGGHCDVAVATTGNAGPTSEKENDAGHCFIAVGDSKGIHIYEYRFAGTRDEVIESGVKHALFRLYRKLKENEFQTLLQEQADRQAEQAEKS